MSRDSLQTQQEALPCIAFRNQDDLFVRGSFLDMCSYNKSTGGGL